MLPQATPGYLYLYICTSSFALNKTGQNQIFKQSQQTLVACFSMSILQCCPELRTFLIVSLSVGLSPPPYNAISCSYSFFQCECACMHVCMWGREKEREEEKKQKVPQEHLCILPSEWGSKNPEERKEDNFRSFINFQQFLHYHISGWRESEHLIESPLCFWRA